MRYTYSLTGWEGTQPDQGVLDDAYTKGLKKIQGKYYLGDAGYTNSQWVLTPYRNTRYHLKEWRRCRLAPQNSKELFNLRHSSKRNLAERTIGVTKAKFAILQRMQPYSFDDQIAIVECCFILHNYIRETNLSDRDFLAAAVYDDDESDDDDDNDDDDDDRGNVNRAAANAMRDALANQMWADYQLQMA